MSSSTANDAHVFPFSSQPTAFSRIAPELWCRILEYFDPYEQREDLIACSLSCPQLVHPSHYTLFRKLGLHTDRDLSPILVRLGNSPGFAQYIRHLDIADLQSGREWAGNVPGLNDLLKQCTGVVKLSIYAREWMKNAPPKIKNGFLVSINTRRCQTGLLFRSLSSVHTIEIKEESSLEDTALPEVLNSFPGLKTLVINNLFREGQTPSKGYEVPPTFSLHTLVLSFCVDISFLKWLSPALEGLVHLTITSNTALGSPGVDTRTPGGEDGTVFIELKGWIRDIGHSITSLTLDSSYTTQGEPFTLIHGNNINLLLGFKELLSLLQFTPRVEKVTIAGLSLDSTDDFKYALDLLGQSKLDSLKQLSFRCYISTSTTSERLNDDTIWKYIQTTLKGGEKTFDDLNLTINLDFIIGDAEDIDRESEAYLAAYQTLEERPHCILSHFSSSKKLQISRCLRK